MKRLKIFICCVVTAIMVAMIIASFIYLSDGGKILIFTEKTLACYAGNGAFVVLIYSVPAAIGCICIKAIVDL